MMNYILPTTTAILCGISFLLMLRDQEKCPVREGEPPENAAGMKPMVIYSVIMILVTIGAAVMCGVYYPENNPFTSMKRMMLLSVLWPVAYIDFRTYRIPNAFVLYGLACRAALLPLELMFNGVLFKVDIVSELVAAAALFLASMLCAVCFKGSIGYGDIKLFLVMGLLLGLEDSWGAVFASLLVSFCVAVFLLVTKKKGRKDAIPFGPAIVLGTYISVCLTGM